MRIRQLLVAGGVLSTLALAACTGASSPQPRPTSVRSSSAAPTSSPSAVANLRGASVRRGLPCPSTIDDLAALEPAESAPAQRLSGVTALTLCAYPRYKGAANGTLTADGPDFSTAVALLSRPNVPTPAGMACTADAEAVVVILADSPHGTYLVHPPVGICFKYLKPLPHP
jgi:hypothetical protein